MKSAIRNLKSAILLALILPIILPSSLTTHAQSPAWAWPDEWQADSAFFNVWSRPDAPVAMQAANRSWLWGPVPFAVANEPYAESSTGLRLVEYLDKGRMEINDPTADRTSPWFVTSGLLVNEMVTGQYQTGNNTFQTRPPADIPVAGDDYSPDAPTFASFANFLHSDQNQVPCCDSIELKLPAQITRDGILQFESNPDVRTSKVTDQLISARYDETTGHNIPRVFTDWMAQSGPILENGHLTTSTLIDPLYLLGHPITEPYWADIRIDGKPATVLVQLYERRALTYNPANPPEWQVEMANVGRAYYNWLYREKLPSPAIATNLTTQGTTNSILFHGYNWPPNTPVHLRVALNNSPDSLIGPLDITTNPQGRFASNLLITPQLTAAQDAHADIRAYAESNDTSISLPFATPSTSAPIPLAGTIVGIENTDAKDTYTLTVSDTNANYTSFNYSFARIRVLPSTTITYAEGTPARLSDLDVNSYISLQVTQSAGTLTATSIQLLSTSSSRAWVDYKWTADSKHLTVTGSNWPTSTDVEFTICNTTCDFVPQSIPQGYYGVPDPFATLKTDSRGNLTGTITPPPFDSLRLLQAAAGKKATVSRLIAPQINSSQVEDLNVVLMGRAGIQSAKLGDICCAGGDYLPPTAQLPAFALPVTHGETLTFRSQYGPNPNTGITPVAFSATFYPLPPNIDLPALAADYSRRESDAAYTTTSTSGTPFALTISQTLPAGLYGIYLHVAWHSPVLPIGLTGETPYLMVINVK